MIVEKSNKEHLFDLLYVSHNVLKKTYISTHQNVLILQQDISSLELLWPRN